MKSKQPMIITAYYNLAKAEDPDTLSEQDKFFLCKDLKRMGKSLFKSKLKRCMINILREDNGLEPLKNH